MTTSTPTIRNSFMGALVPESSYPVNAPLTRANPLIRMDRDLLLSFGVALAVGLLVGLERQMALARKGGGELLLGGVRTFPLIALFGALSSLLSRALGPWI